MERAELGAVVEIDGELHRLVAIGDGRTLHFRSVVRKVCATCGRPFDSHYLEGAPNYKQDVTPVRTVDHG
jgi:hypothetical protein